MPTKHLKGRLLVGAGGGIALYKVCSLVSTWAKFEAPIRVVLTDHAQDFVTALTFSTLARHPAYTDQDFWQPNVGRPVHIELGEWAELIVLAPLTAHTLAKLAHGLADNLLTNTVLASTCPVLLVPAMNTAMWEQESVQRNLQLVLSDPRYHLLSPGSGRLACDTVGSGRMAEPEQILVYAQSLFWTGGKRDLVGQRVLVSAGGTREYLDSVRFIGNPATGKMGIALAQAAYHRGATVTLVHGPSYETIPDYCTAYAVETADQMAQVLAQQMPDHDLLLMNAAVGDVRPTQSYSHKLAKQDLPTAIPLTVVPDILEQLIKHKRADQRVIGFAAQTGEVLAAAQAKLHRKNLDALFVNPIDQPAGGFGAVDNHGWLLWPDGQSLYCPPTSKLALAHQILDADLFKALKPTAEWGLET